VLQPDAEYFTGVVKSYSVRRGFGFVACEETALRWGRDAYLSKVESLAALNNGEELLKDGDIVRFAVVMSEEGFPQAAGIQKLEQLRGTVIRFCAEQGGAIACGSDRCFVGEILVRPSSCGQLILYPGDEVYFCLPRHAKDGLMEAQLVQLISTSRPPHAMLGCFSMELPWSTPSPETTAPPPVMLDGHAFANRIVLCGLPVGIGETELMQFFGKHGATEVIVSRGRDEDVATVQLADTASIARLLTGRTHAFNDQTSTLLVRFDPCRSGPPTKLPAPFAPALLPAEGGSLLVSWASPDIAVACVVEIRVAGAGSWSAIDANGRVQPAGAAPLLKPQSTCIAIGGLTSGTMYEARVSFLASCGCRSKASDPSAACMSRLTAPALPLPSAQLPLVETPQLPTPTFSSFPQIQMSSPCGALSMQVPMACGPCSPCSSSLPLAVSSPCQPAHMQMHCGPNCCPHGVPLLQVASPPKLCIVDETGTTLGIQWYGVKSSASSYIVEICEGGAPKTHRCACPPPAQETDLLELRVSGFAAGQCYAACVRLVTPCGCESMPSPWSPWVTLPAMSVAEQRAGDVSMLAGLHSPSVTPPMSPHSLLRRTQGLLPAKTKSDLLGLGVARVMPAPEVAGHEDEAIFLD